MGNFKFMKRIDLNKPTQKELKKISLSKNKTHLHL